MPNRERLNLETYKMRRLLNFVKGLDCAIKTWEKILLINQSRHGVDKHPP